MKGRREREKAESFISSLYDQAKANQQKQATIKGEHGTNH